MGGNDLKKNRKKEIHALNNITSFIPKKKKKKQNNKFKIKGLLQFETNYACT